MPTTEPTINDALAELLRNTRRAWRAPGVVRSENTGMLAGSNARPDILVLETYVSPVVIETEVTPAISVEDDAKARLGHRVRDTARMILSSVALRLPERLRTKDGPQLADELANADDLEMALFTGESASTFTRWPSTGWMSGSIARLSILAQSASIPPVVIEKAADQLVNGVKAAAGLLRELSSAHPEASRNIARELRQDDGDQTRRMAATILANALVFQETLAGGPGELADVKSIEQLRTPDGGLPKSAVLAEWRKILRVNYWPIFDIARRILEIVPATDSSPILDGLATTADSLLQHRLMRSHDLTGAVFQQLIADRKFLAAFYTTPASASLLVGLSIHPDATPSGGAWSSVEDVVSLRIADFACGTGTLLSTAYQRIGQLHEFAGGDAEAIHPAMMASALVGCDVLPAAAHLTASMLAGAHPIIKCEQSSILTVAYGRQPDGAVALGSLDLLDRQGRLEVLAITAKAAEGLGESDRETWRTLPHASFDLVIMNPPFTRPTGHEGAKIGVPNPMFAAFDSDVHEQQMMGKALARLTNGTSAHGNAGEASAFLVLADRMVKLSGTLAMVMPLSLLSGEAWEASRALLARHYTELVLVSIAGEDDADLSFSANTSMGECLVVGRKSDTASTRATFVVLGERPAFPLLGASAAEQVRRRVTGGDLRKLEDGPVGGTPITFGADLIGQVLDAPLAATSGWRLARISDLSLAQTAYQFETMKRVWLPSMHESEAVGAPITTVSAVGAIGPYHADIHGNTSTGGIRGPFDIQHVKPNSAPTYPVLWSHDAERERTIQFSADYEGIPRRAARHEDQASVDRKVADVWNTASHCHFNRDFRFNSQSTAMQFTPRQTLGGRAWISIRLPFVEQEKALALWANTSLGLLLYWWHANKQQAGRGSIGVLPLQNLPVLDVTALTPEQLGRASALFDDMKDRPMLPVNEVDRDTTRKELDERFGCEVMGLPQPLVVPGGPLDILRMKLSREPSVRGGKG